MKTKSLHNKLVEWRHDLHMNPQISFEEEYASNKVANLLKEFGIVVHPGIAKTGVVGVLKKGKGNKSIGIRADIDALPINEKNTFSYKSKIENRMHACGHDGHTTMLLGAAKYLAENSNFDGTIYFIFQPDEENCFGAKTMIEEGLFSNFSIDEVYAMHNIPNMELGSFGTRKGAITASENLFEINIQAKGGHAALPHMGVDAITVGSQVAIALQSIVSRKLNPADNGIVSITEFITDGKKNVLPGKVKITGDARALSKTTNEMIEKNMKQIVKGVCEAHEVSYDVTYKTSCPITLNDSEQAESATKAAKSLLGEKKTNGNIEPRLFSEDFSIMSAEKPGCFVLMGNGTKGSNAKPLHAADYDFNDELLVIGSSYWVELAEQQLK
ncbi:MAG: putative hydrolase YxeP [Alphaproteobacteria bacterium MarineAlpha5_Bin8]|nr:MAG: putative hydrolase YxeP [Alphaproteobacteria bacterium MarineAlpha5_Bin7]PPR47164.1 MAG: putative hydrolase YxeP [Alphaproteobacteria bacterium MarineAlpha5_Bin8]PPR54186.1 MAG: putative hydrolase YxeP [Alphaproteobacteria bacterium MarineAlpha5_Bin6]|tara:strand:+ start:57 stop:1211 length:1155 start_codon:yes stop_codon:yes gene_type:complete